VPLQTKTASTTNVAAAAAAPATDVVKVNKWDLTAVRNALDEAVHGVC
jgi:hypothetical protein